MKTSTAFISSNAFRKGAFVALACAAIVLLAPRAHADEPVQITISAPSTKIIGHYPDLTPIEQVTVSAKVPFNPAYLKTSAGVALLKERVLQAARNVCWATDYQAEDTDSECVSRTVRAADPQVDAAIARAKGSDPVAQR